MTEVFLAAFLVEIGQNGTRPRFVPRFAKNYIKIVFGKV